jgi:regulator of protease activity HflC (stomatin/prohibitin superfamily)
MLGIRYLKTPSTTYVLQTKGGRVIREGAGLSFFYFAPATNIAQVPISSVDVPFAFTEITSDFQEVVVQGNLTYRVVEPAQLATLLDYTVDVRGRYVSDDPSKLGERLVHVAQTGARRYIQTLPLREILVSFATLAEAVTAALTTSTTVTRLGVEVLDVAVSTIKPDPEMSRALQADAREQLLKQADEAIYARRNTAVELERSIREAELQTENAVAQRQREIRQTQMDAEIAVEQQRRQLVDTRVENERKEAESRGSALKAMLDPVRDIDWRTLLAMQGNADAATLISSAFDQLAQGAERIGNLNISPELLETLANRHRK